jgi:uncharacterized protein YbgA (DUF1722 family)
MNAFGYFLLFLIIAFPIAWAISEFKGSRKVRLALGVGAMAMSFGLAALVGMLQQFNYNTWFGEYTKKLVDATVQQLEAGNTTNVLSAFKQLQGAYQPTYENRAKYNLLVSNAVSSMNQPSHSSR